MGSFTTAGSSIRDIGGLDNGYLASYTNFPGPSQPDQLEIWDVSNPADPQLCSSVADNFHTELLTSNNTEILVDYSSAQNGIRLYDASDPYQVTSTVVFEYPFEFNDGPTATAEAGYLYLVKTHHLQVLDISDPHTLQAGPEIYIPDGFKFIRQGQFGYLLGAKLVFDLTDPLVPRSIGAFRHPDFESMIKLTAGDGYLVFEDWDYNRLEMPEHGTPAAPVPEPLPRVTDLNLSAAPNPFNPRVVISFEMPIAGEATLLLHDVRGHRLDSHKLKVDQPGPTQMVWNGTDSAGRPLPSGVYLVEVRTDVGRDWMKVMLVR